MINVAVFNIKDLLKVLLKLSFIFIAIWAIVNCYKNVEKNIYISSLDKTIPAIVYYKNIEQQKEDKKITISEYLLNSQFAIRNAMAKVEDIVENDEVAHTDEFNEKLQTTVIDDNNIQTTYTNTYKSVEVKNSSKYEITDEILKPDIKLSNKSDIIIFHTHTCESYTPSESFNYEMTGTYRTTDLNYSVSRVGDELDKNLTKMGYNVLHDKTVNDYPAYTGSYSRSLEAVRRDLEKQNNTEIIFDLHRDAVGSKENYAPTVKIGEEYAAQIMFVIGTDGGGLEHPNWQQNLKFAVKVQEKANELYPGLFRPIILRNSRYNQHVSKAATIIEIGATGNTMEQCVASMKYFSHILDEVLKEE